MEFHYGPGGSLLCDEPIEKVTTAIEEESVQFYGHAHMVGESMSWSAARRIAALLGGYLADDYEGGI